MVRGLSVSAFVLPKPTLASAIRTVVGDGVNYHAFPSIRLSPDGQTVYCAYKAGTHNPYPPQAIKFISRSVAFGSSWSSPVTVMSYDNVLDRTPTGPDLFVTSTGRIVLTTTVVNNGGSYYRRPHLAYSDDGGVTWTVVGEILSRYDYWDTPCKAVEIGGTIYLTHYGGMETDLGSTYRAGLTASSDNATTWELSDEIANGANYGLQFEEPGIYKLPSSGRIVVLLRTDQRSQILMADTASVGGAWHAPTVVGRGYACASAAVFSDDTMLLCQRWPANDLGGQGAAFYCLRRETSGIVRASPPAFLDPLCPRTGTRRQMYGEGVALNSTTALYVWAHDDGTYVGESTIYEAEVSI